MVRYFSFSFIKFSAQKRMQRCLVLSGGGEGAILRFFATPPR